MADGGSPLPKPPGHEYSAATPPRPQPPPSHFYVSVPSQAGGGQRPKPKRRRRSCCCACCICCAWTFLILIILILILAMSIAGLVAWYWPRLPEFQIEKLKVAKFDVKGGVLDAGVDVSVALVNKNHKLGFGYEDVLVQVSTELVSLGHVSVPDFEQEPDNTTVIAVHSKVAGVTIGDSSSEKLKKNFVDGDMVLNAVVYGKVRVIVDEHKSAGLPLKLACMHVDQAKVASGETPKCEIFLFGLIPLEQIIS